VSSVRYEMGFYIPEDDILHVQIVFLFYFTASSLYNNLIYAIFGLFELTLQ
jgi:hypothetical protein